MARIKHIAISTHDPEGTARFYEQVMGLKIVDRLDGADTTGVFLTDGEISLALLHFKTEEAALMPGGTEYVGLHHFGFLVEDGAEKARVLAKLAELRAPALQGGPLDAQGEHGIFVELKFKDPNGVTFDVAEGGWPGAGR
jgi:catechol 2,3-dioxygenase-like lactoylglutathione lyase family enzyme